MNTLDPATLFIGIFKNLFLDFFRIIQDELVDPIIDCFVDSKQLKDSYVLDFSTRKIYLGRLFCKLIHFIPMVIMIVLIMKFVNGK